MQSVSRSRIPIAIVTLVAVAAVALSGSRSTYAQSADVPQGENVRLAVRPAAPGGTFRFQLASPYGQSSYSIHALSPTRELFSVASGDTDGDGRALVELGLVDELGIADANLSFFAEVTSPQGPRTSAWVHVRVPTEESPERTSFTVREDVLPLAGGLFGDWLELADIDGDGDLDVIVPGARAETIEVIVEHMDRGAFHSRELVESLDQSWKLADGSYQIQNLGDGAQSAPATRAYFSFDLSGVSRPIVAAEVRIAHPANSYNSPDETETIALFEVSTPAAELAAPDESLGLDYLEEIFEDITSGVQYGSFDATAEDVGAIEAVTLNAEAVAALNKAAGTGEWSVGTELTTAGSAIGLGELERVFRGSGSAAPATQLVLTIAVPDAPGTEYVRIFENDGSGEFTETTSTALSADDQRSASRVFVADLTGDGLPDFLATPLPNDATGELDASVWLFVNQGDGSFSRDAAFPAKAAAGLAPFTAAFGDIDADGDIDVFIGNRQGGAHSAKTPQPQSNEILLNDGTGSFTPLAGFYEDAFNNPPSLTRTAAFGDLDNDGTLDLFVANSGANQLLLNLGDGTFEDTTVSMPAAQESTWGVKFVDVDGDADNDIVLSNTVFNPFAQTVLLNAGGLQEGTLGQFQTAPFPMAVAGQSAIRLGLEVVDLNADGLPDIVLPIHELGAGERPDVYYNEGGTFARDPDFEASRGVYSKLASGDIDGDGDVDLIIPKSDTFGPKDRIQFYALINETFSATDAPMVWLRGDANSDANVDISDPTRILNFLFLGGEEPDCLASADGNQSGEVDLSDAVYILNHLFLGGPTPAAPYPTFGDAEETPSVSCRRVAILQ